MDILANGKILRRSAYLSSINYKKTVLNTCFLISLNYESKILREKVVKQYEKTDRSMD